MLESGLNNNVDNLLMSTLMSVKSPSDVDFFKIGGSDIFYATKLYFELKFNHCQDTELWIRKLMAKCYGFGRIQQMQMLFNKVLARLYFLDLGLFVLT